MQKLISLRNWKKQIKGKTFQFISSKSEDQQEHMTQLNDSSFQRTLTTRFFYWSVSCLHCACIAVVHASFLESNCIISRARYWLLCNAEHLTSSGTALPAHFCLSAPGSRVHVLQTLLIGLRLPCIYHRLTPSTTCTYVVSKFPCI